MTQEIQRARDFAIERHEGQKYGLLKYEKHLEDIIDILNRYEISTDLRIVCAYLHDTVEDTKTTLQEIESKFGRAVARLVDFCTDETGKNRAEKKRNTYPKWKRLLDEDCLFYEDAVILKLCDRIANLENAKNRGNDNLLQMYLVENKEFISTLSNREYKNQKTIDALMARVNSLLGQTKK